MEGSEKKMFEVRDKVEETLEFVKVQYKKKDKVQHNDNQHVQKEYGFNRYEGFKKSQNGPNAQSKQIPQKHAFNKMEFNKKDASQAATSENTKKPDSKIETGQNKNPLKRMYGLLKRIYCKL